MIYLSSLLILQATLLLLCMGVKGFQQRRLSSVVFLGSAAYAFFAVANAEGLAATFGEDVYAQMSILYVSGAVAMALSVQFFSGFVATKRLSLPIWRQSDFRQHSFLATVLAFASIALIVIARDQNIFDSWSEARESAGFLTALATACFMLASPGIVSAIFCKQWVLGAFLLCLSLSLFVVIGSRASLLASLALGIWVVFSRARRGSSQLIIIGSALVVVFTVHTFLRTLRGFGIAGLMDALSNGNLLEVLFFAEGAIDISGGEADMPQSLMFAITQSSMQDFGFMTSIQRLLLLPIPSITGWISKPQDVTNILWGKAFEQGLLAGEQGQAILFETYLTGTLGSWHSTIFGEYFLSGGWVSLILSLAILGFVLVAIDFYMQQADRLTSLALCGPILVGYLFVARGNSIVGLGYVLYFGVLLSMLLYAARHFYMLLLSTANRGASTSYKSR